VLHLPIFLVTTPSKDPAGNLPFKVVIGTIIAFPFLLLWLTRGPSLSDKPLLRVWYEGGFRFCNTEPIINQLYILIITIQRYIHFSFYIVLCFPFHVHDRVKNIVKHFFFLNMHCIQIIADDISLPIRKLLENILFYLIIGHTKTKELLFTSMKTKYNAFILCDFIIHFFTRQ